MERGGKTNYVWVGDRVVLELENDQVKARYCQGLDLIARVGSETEYYLYNAHGDVVQTVDPNGRQKRSYEYDAFGNQFNPDADDENPFRYSGEQYEPETGEIYLRNRTYMPKMGRFTTEDPIKDGANWYTYCANNPILYSDPSGLRITMSEEDSETVLSLLQALTDDRLAYRDGSVVITESYDPYRPVGTTLVKMLIRASETVDIHIGVSYTGRTNWTAPMTEDGIIDIYIDPNHEFKNKGKTHSTYTSPYESDLHARSIDEIKSNVKEEFPEYIILGHELIHAWRQIVGKFSTSEEDYFIPADEGAKRSEEEVKTMGIDYKHLHGKWSTYPTYWGTLTENGLRLENGLNVRISYHGPWN